MDQKKKKMMMMTTTAVTATDTSPSSDRLQTSSSSCYSQSFLQGREEVMVTAVAADDTTGIQEEILVTDT